MYMDCQKDRPFQYASDSLILEHGIVAGEIAINPYKTLHQYARRTVRYPYHSGNKTAAESLS